VDNVRSVERALDILLAFVSNPVMGVAAIQEQVGLSRPTLYRILNTLENKALLRSFGEPRQYQLNYRILELANAWVSVVDLLEISQPYLRSLWEQTNETVSLYELDGDEQRACIYEMRSKNSLSFAPGLGARPLSRGAPGKAILAYMPSPNIQRALASADHGFASYAAAEEELQRIGKAGYCISRGELIVGGASIAAPLFSRDMTVVGSIALAIPEARLTKEIQAELIRLVKATAGQISHALGYVGPQDKHDRV